MGEKLFGGHGVGGSTDVDSKPAIRQFVKATKEVGYSKEQRRKRFEQFHEGGMEDISAIEAVKERRLNKSHIEAILKNIVGDKSLGITFDNNKIKEVAYALYDYGYRPGNEQYIRSTSSAELKEISVLIKLVEDYFLSGRFLEIVENDAVNSKASNGNVPSNRLTADITFLINVLAKIIANKANNSGMVALDKEKIIDLTGEVYEFAEKYFTRDVCGKLLHGYIADETIDTFLNKLKQKFDESLQSVMSAIEDSEKKKDNLMYIIKNTMIAAAFTNKSNMGPVALAAVHDSKKKYCFL